MLKFPADTAIRGRSSAPVFQRNILCRGDGRTSSAVKGSFRQRLTALCLARLRRPRPRFARHFAAPHPLHAALPYGGGRLQSSLTLAPPAVKGAYFSLINRKLEQSQTIKCLSRGARQGENRRKRLYFHRTVKMKQPHTRTEPIDFTMV